jgi:surface antigen
VKATIARRVRLRPVILVAILALLTAGIASMGVSPAWASSGSTICSSSTSNWSCVSGNVTYTDHGYGANSGNMYWSEYSGHNCTNYVAYAEIQNGASSSYAPGNAYQWGAYFSSSSHGGYTVDGNPAVGSVAWWNANQGPADSSGHVAYVEAVNENTSGVITSITVSEDNWGGVFDWATIPVGSPNYPVGNSTTSGFIHINDLPTTVTRRADDGVDATSWGNGRIDIFARGSHGDLIHTFYDQSTGGWSNTWESLGGGILGTPSAVSWYAGRIDVFVRGADNHLWQRTYTNTGGWTQWVNLGGTLGSSPTAVSWGNGRIDIFARGTGGDLIHTFYDQSTGGWSNTWASLGGGIQNAPSAVSWGTNELEVYSEGTDGHLWSTTYDPTNGWVWSYVGGTLGSGPGAVSWSPGRTDVFVRGTASDLDHTFYDSGAWSNNWESLAGGIAGPPSAVSWYGGRIDVFMRGNDEQLWQLTYTTSGGWGTWVPLGGTLY